jgi:deoxyribodipyrimidine photo-lyase
MTAPPHLSATHTFESTTLLPKTSEIRIDPTLPCFIYNYYNLDPQWHATESGNRILLLEPEFFKDYPISEKCIEFFLALSRNIPGIQIFVGSFADLKVRCAHQNIYYKEHPLHLGYIGLEEPRDWISEKVIGYFPSFFSYWKNVAKYLKD